MIVLPFRHQPVMHKTVTAPVADVPLTSACQRWPYGLAQAERQADHDQTFPGPPGTSPSPRIRQVLVWPGHRRLSSRHRKAPFRASCRRELRARGLTGKLPVPGRGING